MPAAPTSDGTTTAATVAVEPPLEAPSTSPPPAPLYKEVEFAADGGPTLRGRVWSDGRIGLVLAHGFSEFSGQDDWNTFAEYLAGLDYGVLTFDFRGFCDRDGCSEGSLELERTGATSPPLSSFSRSRGSERPYCRRCQHGRYRHVPAADDAELDLAGIVSLATPQYPSIYYDVEPAENDVTPERLQRIVAPKLFIAGADDVQLPGQAPLRSGVEFVRFADDARAMFEASAEPKQLEIVDSRMHSSELVVNTRFDPEVVEHTRELIVAFIEKHA